MEKDLRDIQMQTKRAIQTVQSERDLTRLYLEIFGKKGILTQLLKKISSLSEDVRPRMGVLVNSVKEDVFSLFEEKRKQFSATSLSEWLDVTVPGIRPSSGSLHLVTQAISEITRLFERIGFTRVRYPEVEWEWFAFSSLNMPEDHPARDDFETFFLDYPSHDTFGRMVLSPHTSSGQVREMLAHGTPPIRMINIAKCYRPNWDVSHTPMFHQFEGLVIDEDITIAHLKGTFEYFAREFFGPKRQIRLRPFHFQFTEPSFEVDITCDVCSGTGTLHPREGEQSACRLCKDGWLELGGAGMVHPNVLKAGRINPKKYSGYAFGWGIERTYLMKEGLHIADLRLLYGNDVRFLTQF